MSLCSAFDFKTPKGRRNSSLAAVSTVVIIGAVSLFFKTYPHLNPLNSLKTEDSKIDKTSQDTDLTEESTVLIEKEIEAWNEDELKAYLIEQEITAPEEATINDLIALVKSIKSN